MAKVIAARSTGYAARARWCVHSRGATNEKYIVRVSGHWEFICELSECLLALLNIRCTYPYSYDELRLSRCHIGPSVWRGCTSFIVF